MTELKVKDKDHLVRDTYSGAILNTDESAFNKSRKIRMEAQRQRDELRNAVREINTIKSEMHEMKSMMKQILEKSNADRSVLASNSFETFRTTFNSTASDVGDIANLLAATGTIASSTDVVEAIVALNAVAFDATANISFSGNNTFSGSSTFAGVTLSSGALTFADGTSQSTSCNNTRVCDCSRSCTWINNREKHKWQIILKIHS